MIQDEERLLVAFTDIEEDSLNKSQDDQRMNPSGGIFHNIDATTDSLTGGTTFLWKMIWTAMMDMKLSHKKGACVFTDRWRLNELAYGIPSDGPYHTNPPSIDVMTSLSPLPPFFPNWIERQVLSHPQAKKLMFLNIKFSLVKSCQL
ncbi:hypothetical protein Tco_0006597 [Tanacetum coccineum]